MKVCYTNSSFKKPTILLSNMRPTSASNQIPALKWTILYLRVIGVFEKKITIRGIVCILSLSCLAMEIIIDFIIHYEGIKSLRRVIYLPAFVLIIVKGAYLIMHSKEMIALEAMLKHFWRANDFDQDTADKVNKVFGLMSRIVQIYMSTCVFFCFGILILPLFDKNHLSLVYTDFAFCNLESIICWLCNYVWQGLLMIFQGVPAGIGFDMIFILFTGYIYNACQLLHTGLQRLNSDNPYVRKHMLRKVVQQHDLVISFVQALNKLCTKIMFLQFTLTLWSLVVCLYMMVANGVPPSVEDATYFGFLYVLFCNQLFVYAYCGAIIEEEIKSISYSVFLVDWYKKGRTELRKNLSLMIQRAQNTRPLNAGKMIDLNLPLWVATVKNAISIFTLIHQMEHQSEE